MNDSATEPETPFTSQVTEPGGDASLLARLWRRAGARDDARYADHVRLRRMAPPRRPGSAEARESPMDPDARPRRPADLEPSAQPLPVKACC